MKLCFPLINTIKITNYILHQIHCWCWNQLFYKRSFHLLPANSYFFFKVGVLIEITRYWSTWLVSLSIKTSIKEILCGMTEIEILCGIQLSSWNIFPLPRSLCSDMFEFLLETPRILHSGISVYCWNVKYSSPTEKYAQGKRHHWCYSNCLLILGLLFWLIWKEDLNMDLKYTKVTHIYVTNWRTWSFQSNSIKREFDCFMMCPIGPGPEECPRYQISWKFSDV